MDRLGPQISCVPVCASDVHLHRPSVLPKNFRWVSAYNCDECVVQCFVIQPTLFNFHLSFKSYERLNLNLSLSMLPNRAIWFDFGAKTRPSMTELENGLTTVRPACASQIHITAPRMDSHAGEREPWCQDLRNHQTLSYIRCARED